MFRIQGSPGKDLCDAHLRVSRRDVLRVGGSGLLGLSLGNMLQLQSHANEAKVISAPGWGKAKSIIMVYLQGGPSHLDLWDPKENVPENVLHDILDLLKGFQNHPDDKIEMTHSLRQILTEDKELLEKLAK